MFKSATMLSLRAAAAAGSSVLLAASASSAFAQSDEKANVVPPPFVGDVKTAPKSYGQEPTDAASLTAPALAPIQAAAGQKDSNLENAMAGLTAGDLFANVLFDTSADGSMWARGRTYKAHFAADGFTYVPFLGADAPRNYPVRMIIDGIEIGGQPMEMTGAVITRDGNEVAINRGSVVEQYSLAPESVEQLFTFAAKPGSGDVKIRMHVESELGAGERDGALTFGNDRGEVSYTKAVVVDARQTQTAVPTKLVDSNTVEITLPASLVASAKYPLTVDPVMTTTALGAPSNSSTSGRSDVSYDLTTNTYLLVWEDNFSSIDGDIFTMRINSNGSVVVGSEATIDFTNTDCRSPKIANNNLDNNYLIVYASGVAGSREIMGRLQVAGTTTVGAEFQISEGSFTGDHHDPDVGGDPSLVFPTYFCVVWQRDYDADDTDILGRMINPVTATAFGGTIQLENSGGTFHRNPAISNTNGRGPSQDQQWTVVWQFKQSSTNEDIIGAQLNYSGSVTYAAFPINAAATNDINPTVSTMILPSKQYMVAYEEDGLYIHARAYTGTTFNMSANLTALEGAFPGQRAWGPVLDATDGKFVLAYNQTVPAFPDADAFISTFCTSSGSIRVAEAHRLLANTTSEEDQLAVVSTYAAGGSGLVRDCLVSWTKRPAGGYGQVFLGEYRGHASCCLGDVAPAGGNGVIDVNDLLAVISEWGNVSGNTPGDINGNYVVDVNDLLAVVTTWGPCP